MGALDGKVAIVAGSSRGIGKAIAKVYAFEGAGIAVVARTQTPGKIPGTIHQTVTEISEAGGAAFAFSCDVTNEEQVSSMVDQVTRKLGPPDILVNSTAVISYRKIAEESVKRWRLLFEVNVNGALILSKAVLPGMIDRRRGNIIHLTSAAANRIGKGGSAYGSTKSALERFCFGLAHEVSEYNIAVNCLDPGPIKTEGAVFTQGEHFDWTGWADPVDVGPLALHLAGQTSKTLSGRVLRRLEFEN